MGEKMNHITPNNIQPKAPVENRTKKSKKNKINRSAIPTQNSEHATIQPNLTKLKSVAETIKPTFADLGISVKGCDTLKTIAESSQYSGRFPLFITIAHYLHQQITSLIDQHKTSITLKNSFEQFQGFIYIESFSSISGKINSDSMYQTCIDNIKGLLSSSSFENEISERFKNFKDKNKINFIKRNVNEKLDKIKSAYLCIEELYKILSKDMIHKMLISNIDKIVYWDQLKTQGSLSLKEELVSYKNCIINISEKVHQDLILHHVLSKNQYELFFEKTLALLELPPQDKEKYFEQISLVQDLFNQFEPNLKCLKSLYDRTKIGDLTFSKYNEEFSIKDQNEDITEDQFVNQINYSFVFSSTLLNAAIAFIVNISQIMENKNVIFISEIEQIKLSIIWKKLDIYAKEGSLDFIENFSQKLKSSTVLSKISPQLIDKCIEPISSIANGLINSENVSNKILSFLEKCLSMNSISQIIKAQKHFNILVESTKNHGKLMEEYNMSIQKELDQCNISDLEELQSLEFAINEFNATISQFYYPFLEIPVVFNNLITSKPYLQSTYVPVIEDVIKKYFNISFKKAYANATKPIKITIEIPKIPREPIQRESKETELAVDKALSTYLIREEKKKVKEIDNAYPQSTRTGIILAFLHERGWEPATNNSSHLKLKKSGQSLIVPISKDTIADGTLSAIFKQLEVKEHKILEQQK